MRTRALSIALLLAASSLPVPVAAEAGKVLFTFQRVEIVRNGITFRAQRGSPVEVGDTVRTSPTGFAQLRMKDGALMSLRRGGELVIEEYSVPPKKVAPTAGAPAAQPVDDAAGGRSILRLVRGAFRTITGLIGRDSSDAYQLKTPAATIGIRGTDYGVAVCAGDCGSQADGLYVGVSQGEIFVTNEVGQLVLYDDQYAYVKDSTSNPEQKLAPPPPLEDPIEPGEEDEEDDSLDDHGTRESHQPPARTDTTATHGDGTAVGGDEPEYEEEIRPASQQRSYAWSTGPINGNSEYSGAGRNDRGNYAVNDSGSLTAFNGTAPSTSGVVAVVGYRIGTARNTNTGFDPETGIRWGRWAGGVAEVGTGSLDLTSQSLHWVTSRERSDVALPTGGTREFTLRGNTDPTDNAGNIGFLGNASFTADFTNSTVTSTLDIGIGNQVWNASGSGDLISGTPLFAGNYDSVSVNGIGGGTGSFTGFFTHEATGAGLSYSLTDGSTSLSGSAAFGFPADGTTAGQP